MFCAPGLIFGGTEGVGSRFQDLRSRTHFRRYRGRPFPFSCFPLPDLFLGVLRVSGPFFTFCTPGLVFGGSEGVGSSFHVSRSRTRFRRYRGRQVPFSCFVLSDSFSAVPRASGSVFMFCPPGLMFDRTDGVRSRFHVMRSRNHFRRCRVRRVPFSCFPLADMFSAVPRESSPLFMFCAPEFIFGGTEGVGFRFHVFPARTRFRRYRRSQVPFSCFSLPESFSAVMSVSGPVFMFSAPGHVFGSNDGVGYHFHVLLARTRFRRYRGRRVSFSCFARPDSFSDIPRASTPVFMFCASGLIFVGTEGVGSRFHLLHARPHFRQC
jgi:hypothetical protein